MQNNSDTRKILSALCHGASLFSYTVICFGVPIAILLTSEDSIVKKNAKEALNFQINIIFYGIICFLLSLLIVGIPLLFILAILSFIVPIIAIVKVASKPDKPYYYPFIFRLF
jgi:uncharacterized Tic20 family protein